MHEEEAEMEYRVDAYKTKINDVIEIGDEMIPVGSFYEGGTLFVIVLDPLGPKNLPEKIYPEDEDEEEQEKREHKVEPGNRADEEQDDIEEDEDTGNKAD